MEMDVELEMELEMETWLSQLSQLFWISLDLFEVGEKRKLSMNQPFIT